MYRNLSTSDRVLSSQIIYLWNHFSKTTVRHIEKTKENSFQFLSFSFRSMKKKTPQKFKIDSATAEKNPPLKSITSLKKLLNKTPTGIGIISILLWLIIIDYYKHTYLLLYFQKRKDWNEESLPTFHHNVTYQREKLLSIIDKFIDYSDYSKKCNHGYIEWYDARMMKKQQRWPPICNNELTT